MNIFPAALAFLLCLFFGFMKSGELKKRSLLLNELKRLIAELSVKLRYTAPTLDELSEDITGAFAELLREERAQTPDIKTAWGNAADRLAAFTFCQREEGALIKELGQALGTCDTAGQLSLLEMYGARLERLAETAEENSKTKGKLFRSVGALLGAGIAVLII